MPVQRRPLAVLQDPERRVRPLPPEKSLYKRGPTDLVQLAWRRLSGFPLPSIKKTHRAPSAGLVWLPSSPKRRYGKTGPPEMAFFSGDKVGDEPAETGSFIVKDKVSAGRLAVLVKV